MVKACRTKSLMGHGGPGTSRLCSALSPTTRCSNGTSKVQPTSPDSYFVLVSFEELKSRIMSRH